MELPNYFIADLPPGATLSSTMLTEACQALKRNRQQYLANRPTQAIIDTLCEIGHNWLQPDDPFRQLALEHGPAQTGFSRETLATGLDALFRRLNFTELQSLILQELGHPERLDRFVVTEPELKTSRSSIAVGPELLVHFSAGNIPSSTLVSLILGLLARSAQFVKCSQGNDLLPRLFAHSLYAIEPKLAACIELATWPGGTLPLESTLFEQASCITAQGSDETLTNLRQRIPPRVRFLGYGHKVSFGYVAREVMSRFHARELATQAAHDVAAWDQLGCLSPHLYYVENHGSVTPELFAQWLGEELEKLQATNPRAKLPPETAAHLADRQALYQLRAANTPSTRIWQSPDNTLWTVVLEDEPRFQTSCLHRFVYVKGVNDPDEALHATTALEGKISTVSLAAMGQRAQEIALALAKWGVTRICPFGKMQDPPLPWRHDGHPALGDLLTWTDWEQ